MYFHYFKLHVCVYVFVRNVHEGRPDPLKPELQAVVNQPMRRLESKLAPSARAVDSLNY